MAENNSGKIEPIYIDVSGDTVTIFVHNYVAKPGTLALCVTLVGLGIFHNYMIESYGTFLVVALALFFLLLIGMGVAALRDTTPLMIMDNERMSFPRVHPEPIAWRDLERIVYKRDHMALHPKQGEPIPIWIDHRWPFPSIVIRDMMIAKRSKADIRMPPDPDFFVTG
ncbi:MAG: hypothetical protein ACKVHL_02865 [Rhodospirillales bacterium]|jgi:hypothetical protein